LPESLVTESRDTRVFRFEARTCLPAQRSGIVLVS
jgi:hypothetical protein